MKLYLASYHIPTPDDLYSLLGSKKVDIKVGLIANAKDYYAPRARALKVQDVHRLLESLGFSVSEVDLRDYVDSENLKHELSKLDLLWVAGGNTFCLRYEMKRSGFDQVIHEVLERGVIYGGDSAGAVVAGSDLRGVELADVPEFAEEIIFDGLNLVPRFILPHVGSAEIGEMVEKVASQRMDDDSLVRLTDHEAMVVENNIIRVVKRSKAP